MHGLLANPALGLSAKERKRSFREKAIREMERSASLGLPTRLPFLRKALCGLDSPCGSAPEPRTVRPSGPFVVKAGIEPILHPREALAEVLHFNSAMHQEGVQFVPVSICGGELARYDTRRCTTAFEGDLKVSSLLDSDPKIGIRNDACYDDHIFQVFIKPRTEHRRLPREVLVHEKEHALHGSLWGLAGFHHALLPLTAKEYLAMLRSLVETGDTGILEGPYTDFLEKLKDGNQRPYAVASAFFVVKALSVHKMTDYEVVLAIGANYWPEQFESGRGPLDRLRRCGEIEYNKAYQALFGMDIDDIREIISGISL